MNFLKRSIRSAVYYKRMSALLFGIFLALSTLILSSLCVRDAVAATADRIRMDMGATLALESAGYLDPNDDYGGNGISLERVMRIASFPEVSQVDYSVFALGFPEGFDAVLHEGQGKAFEMRDGVTALIPHLLLLGDAAFPRGLAPRSEANIIEGVAAHAFGEGGALIHQELAELNGLAVGDRITVESAFTDAAAALTVCGIYVGGGEQPGVRAFENPQNLIYVNGDMATGFIPENDSFATDFRIATVHIADPRDARLVERKARELCRLGSRDLDIIYTRDDILYQSIAESLDGVQAIALAIAAASVAMGAGILLLLATLSMRERDHEIGVLLSMGERRWKVIAQLSFEMLAIVLAAVSCSVLASARAAQAVGEVMGAEGASVALAAGPVAAIYLCGAALTLLASSLPIYKVATCQPKTIMMAME